MNSGMSHLSSEQKYRSIELSRTIPNPEIEIDIRHRSIDTVDLTSNSSRPQHNPPYSYRVDSPAMTRSVVQSGSFAFNVATSVSSPKPLKCSRRAQAGEARELPEFQISASLNPALNLHFFVPCAPDWPRVLGLAPVAPVSRYLG